MYQDFAKFDFSRSKLQYLVIGSRLLNFCKIHVLESVIILHDR
ncbi:hypothetical protein C1A50_0316 [Paenibacillus polymyxa]|nr:hypothetical protein C1A50_0316 [Paenibacillus polymyxa]